MVKKITSSFLLALHNIRSHFFHTLLSVLGIVIGVAALVAILSLIDGMEDYANKQIAETTSLKAIVVRSDVFERVNEVRVRKDTFAILRYEHVAAMKLSHPASLYLRRTSVATISINDSILGTNILASGVLTAPNVRATEGKLFSEDDVVSKKAVALVNDVFVKKAWPNEAFKDILGRSITVAGYTLSVQGILVDERLKSPHLVLPITLLTTEELRSNTPELIVEAEKVEDVPALKEEVITFLKAKYPSYQRDFAVQTNEMRVKQAAQGFLLFRVIMGLIVGISVLVGGIGVMNVLLISVTERTAEIGIRKAVGANRTDIMLQFLSESVTVSAFGSFLGLIIGVLGTMAFIPIIRALTETPFYAMYTWNTLTIIGAVSLAVGIIFGTYPAIRASRLDPVEAIRRE